MILEIVLFCVLYYAVWREGYDSDAFYFKGKYVLTGVYALLILIMFSNLDGFLFDQRRALDLTLGQTIGLFLVNFITYFQLCLIANHMISPLPILYLFAGEFILAVGLIFIFKKIYHRLYAPHSLLLVYGSDNAVSLKIKMDERKDKYNIKKLISVDEGMEAVCKELEGYDGVIFNDLPAQFRNDLLKYCYQRDIRTYIVPKISDILVRGGKNINLFDTPLIHIKQTGISLPQRIIKRLMDIVFSAIILILASPILLGVAIAIKLEDGGDVFYKQRRMTLGGKEFDILKFRSMIQDAEKLSGAVLSAGENDPRITKVGKFVRATRLDEIPQFINILKGDMSIVGPRPERRVFVEEFCEKMPEFAYRMKVKGGLTGYAQIYGKYNTSPYDKLRLDLMYIENYSLQLDIKLIILTIKIIFSKESTEGEELAEINRKKTEALLEELRKKKDS
ncbi:MAG: sugar transferase [Clostridia bacterium]|nr:sugar transferase [Clostridia bacterium]